MSPLHRVLLDTDIGSDVDDALALALILGEPTMRLEGITTVYGDTVLRARIVLNYLHLAGVEALPVVPGDATPHSGREVWWPGHEGTGHMGLDRFMPSDAVSGPAFLVDAVRAAPGAIDVVAIGPLTNVASAISRDPSFVTDVKGIWIMGGAFDRDAPEHNILSDVVAARQVFSSAASLTIVPLEVTERIRLAAAEVKRIELSGDVGAQLWTDIQKWWEVRGTAWSVPHDPLTVLALTNPEIFDFSPPVRVDVEDSGVTRAVPDETSTARLVTAVDADAAAHLIVEGITRASA